MPQWWHGSILIEALGSEGLLGFGKKELLECVPLFESALAGLRSLCIQRGGQ